MKLEIYENLTDSQIKEIENFLLTNKSQFNPLFSTPLWAMRLKRIIGFEYEFLAVKKENKILALHTIFEGYRGFVKIKKLPIGIKGIVKFYARFFYGYVSWDNFIVFNNEITTPDKDDAKRIIYHHLAQKEKKCLASPIYDGDEIFFKNKKVAKYGTYLLEFEGKTYEEIYNMFRRSARRSIEKTLEQDVYVKRLIEEKEVLQWIEWLREAQRETGKSYRIDTSEVFQEFECFKKESYHYEIFVAYQGNEILGSMGIWGFGDFITEFGVNQSKVAKERKLYVQDVIKNEIVKYCFDRGIKFFDLAGFNPGENLTEKEKSIKQFKEKFRGTEILYSMIKE